MENQKEINQSIQTNKNKFIALMNKNINICIQCKQDVYYRFYETFEFIVYEFGNRTTNSYTTYKMSLSDEIFNKTTEFYNKNNTIEIDDNCDFYNPFIKNTQVKLTENFIKNFENGYYRIVYGNEFILVHIILPNYSLEIIKYVYHH